MSKKEYTEEEIFSTKLQIANMSHVELCEIWRFAPKGHFYFDDKLPFAEFFKDRLFDHFDGVTPALRKYLDIISERKKNEVIEELETKTT